jgi:putative Ca2+/H+ antiporter (TMEM165/GDT1 family)/esterase/lipase
METLLSSSVLVAASEMGDKTQLLAFLLVARFKRPVPILAGILVATLLNHGLAAALGSYVAGLVSPNTLRIALAIIFFVFALWTLKSDEHDDKPEDSRWGAFVTTTVLFFLAEMGDKTQLATVALGARFADTLMVTAGTTLGMMAADGFAVFVGHRVAERLPMRWIRRAAALLFFIFGVLVLASDPSSLMKSGEVSRESERAVSGSKAPEERRVEGLWFGERENPRAFVLLAHGLNLKPSKMRALSELVCNEKSKYSCRVLSLPGHEEFGKSQMRKVNTDTWKSRILEEVQQIERLSREHRVPAFFIGYSLGGLLGEWAISQQTGPVFDKVVLIAPAIAIHAYTKIAVFLPMTGGMMVPSKNHPDYRANKGTSIAAYRSMFNFIGEFRNSELRGVDIPTLVFLNQKDELVSHRKLIRWIDSSRLSRWRVDFVPELAPSIKPSYEHLMIDEPSMGSAAWANMSGKVVEFLH